MENKHYIVKAKCGHVGTNKYVIIDFPIRAEDGKAAAAIARKMGRVKHNHKDAIVSVEKVDQFRYIEQKEKNKRNIYLQARCKQEQKEVYLQEGFIHRESQQQKRNNRNIPIRLLKQLLSISDFDPSEYNEMKHIYVWKTRNACLD